MPENVIVKGKNEDCVTLLWGDAKSNLWIPVTNYVVAVIKSGKDTFEEKEELLVETSNNTCTVSNLDLQKSYQFKIAAKNIEGLGPFETCMEFFCTLTFNKDLHAMSMLFTLLNRPCVIICR